MPETLALARVVVAAEHAEMFKGLAEVEIHEDAVYTTLEVAALLRVKARSRKGRQNAVYAIPREQLPRTPNGDFLGADILAYLRSQR